MASILAGSSRRAIDDVGRQERVISQRDQRIPQVSLAAVEVVVSQAIRGESHHVHHLDGGRIAEEARDRRGRPNRIASCNGQRPARSFSAVDVEPWLQESRAPDSKGRIAGSRAGDVIRGFRERHELPVVVADVEDGGFLVPARTWQQFVQDPAPGILRTGDAHQEGDRRSEVHRADVGQWILVADSGAGGDKRGVHVDVVGQVNQLRQIAVLAKEL